MMAPHWREALSDLIATALKTTTTTILKKSTSVVAVDTDQLFLWRWESKDVLTINLKSLAAGTVTEAQKVQQVLKPDDEIDFQVVALELSSSGRHLFLAGLNDLAVLRLPKRFGRHADFDAGADVCLCVASRLGGAVFAGEGGVDVIRVKWHPRDDSVVVLSSDNLLRVFDVGDTEVGPAQLFVLGDAASGHDVSADASRLSAAAALGDVAVDFDFGPPVIGEEMEEESEGREMVEESAKEEEKDDAYSESKVVWPIFVLKDNGDVFRLLSGSDHASSQFTARMDGPLKMLPPADDNYGVDACAILCLDSTPPILVTCTRNGRLYHSIPLANEAETLSSSADHRHSPPSLFVYEAVELELSFNAPMPEEDPDSISCLINLVKDPNTNDRYYCCHQAGLHAVSLPWAGNVESFFDLVADDQEIAGDPAVVEHLVCTQPHASVPPGPLRGVGVTRGPLLGIPTIICLCHDDSLLTVPLNPTLQSIPKDLLSLAPTVPTSASPLKKLEAEPIDKHLQSILARRAVSNPILKAGGGDEPISEQHCLQILIRATQGLRDEYLLRQVQAREELKRRMGLLCESKANQWNQLDQLETKTNIDLREGLERLADKLNTAQETQEDLTRRLEAVMKKLESRSPVLSAAETEMRTELVGIEQRINVLKGNVEQAKIKRRYQLEQRRNLLKSVGVKDAEAAASISSSQKNSIKGLLTDQGRSVQELVDSVKSLNLDIS